MNLATADVEMFNNNNNLFLASSSFQDEDEESLVNSDEIIDSEPFFFSDDITSRDMTSFRVTDAKKSSDDDIDGLRAYILACLVIGESLKNLKDELSDKKNIKPNKKVAKNIVPALEWLENPGNPSEPLTLAFYAQFIEARIEPDIRLVPWLQSFINRPPKEALKVSKIFFKMADIAH